MQIKFGEFVIDKVDMRNEKYKYSNLYDIELYNFDMLIKVKGS